MSVPDKFRPPKPIAERNADGQDGGLEPPMPAAHDHAACTHPRSRASAVLRAFNLIELLVVCIIAVLASLLMAVVGSVRSSARQVHCASNLRQIGVLILSHPTDEKRLSPPATGRSAT